MIGKAEFLGAVDKAYQIVDQLVQDDAAGGRRLLTNRDDLDMARMATKRLVRRSGVAHVVYSKEITKGYGSWLMFTGQRWIGINQSQLSRWSQERLQQPQGRLKMLKHYLYWIGSKGYRYAHKLGFRSMEVRCILHELGHVLLQPHLLDTSRHNRAADPQEEEAAWVFSMTLLGILLGDYAYDSRVKHGMDDSPLVLV